MWGDGFVAIQSVDRQGRDRERERDTRVDQRYTFLPLTFASLHLWIDREQYVQSSVILVGMLLYALCKSICHNSAKKHDVVFLSL